MAFYVIPPNYTTTGGTASFLGPLSNAERTYQLLISDSILNALDGKELSALSWRLYYTASSNWPIADVTFSNFDIYLSASVPPSQRSFTFSQNVVGIQKKVRSGPLTIPANSYTSGGNPNAFGPEITFDSTYLYNGGHLLIEIRHSIFSGTSSSVDAIGTSISGYGTLFSACWTGSYTGTTGVQGNFSVIRLTGNDPVSVKNDKNNTTGFSLNQNYPNPFNPTTQISFSLLTRGNVTLLISDITGRIQDELVKDILYNAGIYTFNYNATQLPSGIYFYTLFVNGRMIDSKKMLLIK